MLPHFVFMGGVISYVPQIRNGGRVLAMRSCLVLEPYPVHRVEAPACLHCPSESESVGRGDGHLVSSNSLNTIHFCLLES